MDGLAGAQPALAEAAARLARVAEMRNALPPLAEPRLQRLLDKLDKLLPLAKDALALAQAAPALLGADGPRTYLLLAQNNDELRATGGFISGAGHVTIDRGRISRPGAEGQLRRGQLGAAAPRAAGSPPQVHGRGSVGAARHQLVSRLPNLRRRCARPIRAGSGRR